MDDTILYLTVFVCLIAVAVATAIIAVRRDGRYAGELIQQFVIWAGIATLLPLTSWAGATLLQPRTKLQELHREESRLRDERYTVNKDDLPEDEAARIARLAERKKENDRIAKEEERLAKEVAAEVRLFNRARFWIAFPVGLITMAAGLFLRPVTVGSSLAFGGLVTLTTGCYSFWDDIDDFLRFISLFVVLVLLVGIGLTKFRRPANGAA